METTSPTLPTVLLEWGRLLIPILGGAFATWMGARFLDRRRLHGEVKKELRQAYSKWFTAWRTTVAQMQSLHELVSEADGYDAVTQAVPAIEATMNDTIRSLHDLYMLDTDVARRDAFRLASDFTAEVHKNFLMSLSGHRVHVSAHAKAGELRERDRQTRREVLKEAASSGGVGLSEELEKAMQRVEGSTAEIQTIADEGRKKCRLCNGLFVEKSRKDLDRATELMNGLLERLGGQWGNG